MHPDAKKLVEALRLEPHPEGGFFRETFRAPFMLSALPHGGLRSAQTAILYLLPGGSVASLHCCRSDEVWHFYDGDPVELHLLDEEEHSIVRLGRDIAAGEVYQTVVPSGVWQAAVSTGSRFSLTGCTVAPGFEFDDFEMPSRAELQKRLPMHADLIAKLTKE